MSWEDNRRRNTIQAAELDIYQAHKPDVTLVQTTFGQRWKFPNTSQTFNIQIPASFITDHLCTATSLSSIELKQPDDPVMGIAAGLRYLFAKSSTANHHVLQSPCTALFKKV